MICAHCRQPIAGQYLRAGSLAFHPEHFLCKACHTPIQGSYQAHKGMWLHPQCFAEQYAPRCALCSKPLTGKFVQSEGKSYHERCYGEHLAVKCQVCLRMIVGPMIKDYWGHVYHAEHAREFGACTYCSKLVHPRISGGGTTYADGRVVCRGCYKLAVTRERDGQAVVARVRQQMAGWGVDLGDVQVPVSFIDRHTLSRRLHGGPHAAAKYVYGLAHMETVRQGRTVTQRRAAVYLLHGLPLQVLEAGAAHELMHVWNFYHCPPHAFALEEGSCNYMSYRMIQGHQGPMADYQIHSMMTDPHPHYGEGFRRVKQYVDKHGFDALLAHLKRSANFPVLGGLF